MEKKQTNLFFTILTIGTLFFLFYLCMKMIYPEFWAQDLSVLYCRDDRFMDFFNPIYYARENAPYLDPYANVPPLIFFFGFRLASLLGGAGMDRYGARFTDAGVTMLWCYWGLTLAVFLLALFLFLQKRETFRQKLVISALFACSYPFLWCFDRGNYVALTAGILALFCVLYERKKLWTAAILLAIAFSMKLYPAVFGIVFLRDKKWKHAGFSALLGAALILFPMMTLTGGLSQNLPVFLQRLSEYGSLGNGVMSQNMAYNNSLYMLFDIPYLLITGNFSADVSLLVPVHRILRIVSILLMAYCVCFACVSKKKHDAYLVMTIGILLFPFVSADYNLTILCLPALLWLYCEAEHTTVMQILLALLLTCKSYFYTLFSQTYRYSGDTTYTTVFRFYGTQFFFPAGATLQYVSVSVQSLLNPLLLLAALVCLTVKRRSDLLAVFRKKVPCSE